MVEDGYEFFAKRQLVTVFSAPNYCGEFDNAGAMMSVDDSLMCSFQILKPAEKKPKFGYGGAGGPGAGGGRGMGAGGGRGGGRVCAMPFPGVDDLLRHSVCSTLCHSQEDTAFV